MRILLLLRHAKALPSSPHGDFDRQLAPRGWRQAEKFGRWLAEKSFAPDLVLASTARRASETADAVMSVPGASPERRNESALYNAEAEGILAIAQMAGAAANVMIIGHNPGIAELALALADDDDKPTRQKMARKYPTCACAILQFGTSGWNKLSLGTGKLLAYVTPASLDRAELDD